LLFSFADTENRSQSRNELRQARIEDLLSQNGIQVKRPDDEVLFFLIMIGESNSMHLHPELIDNMRRKHLYMGCIIS